MRQAGEQTQWFIEALELAAPAQEAPDFWSGLQRAALLLK